MSEKGRAVVPTYDGEDGRGELPDIEFEPGDFIRCGTMPIVCGFVIRPASVARGKLRGYWVDGYNAIGQRGEQFIPRDDAELCQFSDERFARLVAEHSPLLAWPPA